MKSSNIDISGINCFTSNDHSFCCPIIYTNTIHITSNDRSFECPIIYTDTIHITSMNLFKLAHLRPFLANTWEIYWKSTGADCLLLKGFLVHYKTSHENLNELEVSYCEVIARFVCTVCTRRIRWSCQGLTSIPQQIHWIQLKHLLLRLCTTCRYWI